MAYTLTFSPEFKPLILEGKKTVTRRPVKFPCLRSHVDPAIWFWEQITDRLTTVALDADSDLLIPSNTHVLTRSYAASLLAHCPHGIAGDLIELSINSQARPFARAMLSDVSIEHLHDISEQEAISEGMPTDAPLSHFRHTWDVFYARSPYSWTQNPAVWVLTFQLTEVLPEVHP